MRSKNPIGTGNRRLDILFPRFAGGLEDVHLLRSVESGFTAHSIASGVESLCARHICGKFGFQPFLGPPHRVGRRLAVELSTDGLTRGQTGIGVACRLTDGRFELRNVAAAGTGGR